MTLSGSSAKEHPNNFQTTTIISTSIGNITESLFGEGFSQFLIRFLQQDISLTWIIFGTIGNLLSLFVLLRNKMRIHSTFTYLTLLALCDTLVLYFGLLRDFLVHKFSIDVNGDLYCKFHVFSFYFVLHMASWLLVAVNIDRLIAASFLSLSKTWCTPRRALTVSFWIAVVLALLNLHFVYYVGSETDQILTNNSTQSNNYLDHPSFVDIGSHKKDNLVTKSHAENVKLSERQLHMQQLSRVEPAMYSVASYSLLSIHDPRSIDYLKTNLTHVSKQNVLPNHSTSSTTQTPANNSMAGGNEKQLQVNQMVYKRCYIKQNSPRYKYFFMHIFTWIDASAQVALPFIIMVICNINIIHKVLLTKNRTKGKNLKRLRKIKGMCVMIVSVSIIFFVLEAPVLMFICLMQGGYIDNWPYTDLVWTIMNLMMYTNHVINFFSYCMTGTKFRRELLRLLYLHKLIKFLSSYKSLNFFSSTTANNLNSNWRSQGTVRNMLNRNGTGIRSKFENEKDKRLRLDISEMDESNVIRIDLDNPEAKKLAASIYFNKIKTMDFKRRLSESPREKPTDREETRIRLNERKRQSADATIKSDRTHLELQRVTFKDDTHSTDQTRSSANPANPVKATMLTNRILEKRNQLADNSLLNYDPTGWTAASPPQPDLALPNKASNGVAKSSVNERLQSDQQISFFKSLREKFIGSKKRRTRESLMRSSASSRAKRISSASTSATIRRDESMVYVPSVKKKSSRLKTSQSDYPVGSAHKKCLNYDDIDIEIEEDDDDF